MTVSDLKAGFAARFGSQPTQQYFSPGRINLIGEHTDYNGGHVFPCAISLGTYAAVGESGDQAFHLFSASIPNSPVITLPIDALTGGKDGQWSDYFKGMAQQLLKRGATFDRGLNIYIDGDLPNGAGLSSSASIELLTGIILKDNFALKVTMLDLIQDGRATENDFIGVNSGIMDQFAIGMGTKDHATLLDTNTLAYESLPLVLGDNVIVIMNTNKRRELADSKYNERRSECEEALRRLQTQLSIQSLGDLSEDAFDQASYLIYDDTLIKRARHAVFENQRTLKAAAALEQGDLTGFGHLVSASGVSLAYDYEVTGKELDTLVQTALAQPGVLGARMTGAGFGGCAIALVAKTEVPAFTAAVGQVYQETIGYPASFYVAEIADGPRRLD
ncbi:galactokinase [Lacticaseibacillus mingshuiensis]|uniref:Galactokinase n=1 Tax=Lacticaseibacillus mingshuiensis TaxID=2799574 RepID=A0ABW4CL80_9LACO|nr:galactokinase [Lacticaseibacillus mingshuiensis]